MRNAFAQQLVVEAENNSELVFLSGDIGNRLFNSYKEKFVDRFFNCGIAEANMIGVAAGLSLSGFLPVVYTITPFITARCYEQLKIDISYNNVPCVIAGVGGGFSYASLGATHHSMDDISLLRNLPGFQIFCPSDALEVKACLSLALQTKAPVYLRLGKKNEPVFNKEVPQLMVGKFHIQQEGTDIALVVCGNIIPEAYKVAEMLKEKNISCEIVSAFSVKPLDRGYLSNACRRFSKVVLMEEHGSGGFSEAVLKTLHSEGSDLRKVKCFAADDRFYSYSGGQQQARKMAGIDAESILRDLNL